MAVSPGIAELSCGRRFLRFCEGYSDPTAYQTIKNMDKVDERFHKLLRTLFYICEIAGFEIEGRIVLADKKPGECGGETNVHRILQLSDGIKIPIEEFLHSTVTMFDA